MTGNGSFSAWKAREHKRIITHTKAEQVSVSGSAVLDVTYLNLKRCLLPRTASKQSWWRAKSRAHPSHARRVPYSSNTNVPLRECAHRARTDYANCDAHGSHFCLILLRGQRTCSLSLPVRRSWRPKCSAHICALQ